MTVQTTHERPPELDELNRIRLDEDLTFRDLGELLGLSAGTVNKLLTGDQPALYDRTLHKIRRFLDERKAPKRRKRAVS